MDQQKEILEEFVCSLEQLSGIINDITKLEEEKTEAVTQERHDAMDGFLKQEQVHLLKLRGQEQKRLRLAKDMGWGGLTFRQILEQASEPERQRLHPLFGQIDAQIKLLLDTKDTAERIIKVRLREFQSLLYRDQGYVYDGSGSIDAGISSSFHDRYV